MPTVRSAGGLSNLSARTTDAASLEAAHVAGDLAALAFMFRAIAKGSTLLLA